MIPLLSGVFGGLPNPASTARPGEGSPPHFNRTRDDLARNTRRHYRMPIAPPLIAPARRSSLSRSDGSVARDPHALISAEMPDMCARERAGRRRSGATFGLHVQRHGRWRAHVVPGHGTWRGRSPLDSARGREHRVRQGPSRSPGYPAVSDASDLRLGWAIRTLEHGAIGVVLWAPSLLSV